MKRLAAIFAALAASAALADIDLGEVAIAGGSSGPTGWVSYTNTVARPANGSAALVTLQSGATLSADSANWPDGASVLALVAPQGVYSPDPALQLVGYGTWPTNAFQCAAWRVGGTVFVRVVNSLASVPSVTPGEDGAASAPSPVGWTYATSGPLTYQANGNSYDLTLAAGATLAASAANWTDGQAMLCRVRPQGAYVIDGALSLAGYASWPTSDFYAVVWRVGSSFYATIIHS